MRHISPNQSLAGYVGLLPADMETRIYLLSYIHGQYILLTYAMCIDSIATVRSVRLDEWGPIASLQLNKYVLH